MAVSTGFQLLDTPGKQEEATAMVRAGEIAAVPAAGAPGDALIWHPEFGLTGGILSVEEAAQGVGSLSTRGLPVTHTGDERGALPDLERLEAVRVADLEPHFAAPDPDFEVSDGADLSGGFDPRRRIEELQDSGRWEDLPEATRQFMLEMAEDFAETGLVGVSADSETGQALIGLEERQQELSATRQRLEDRYGDLSQMTAAELNEIGFEADLTEAEQDMVLAMARAASPTAGVGTELPDRVAEEGGGEGATAGSGVEDDAPTDEETPDTGGTSGGGGPAGDGTESGGARGPAGLGARLTTLMDRLGAGDLEGALAVLGQGQVSTDPTRWPLGLLALVLLGAGWWIVGRSG